jgi:hypothetical protein
MLCMCVASRYTAPTLIVASWPGMAVRRLAAGAAGKHAGRAQLCWRQGVCRGSWSTAHGTARCVCPQGAEACHERAARVAASVLPQAAGWRRQESGAKRRARSCKEAINVRPMTASSRLPCHFDTKGAQHYRVHECQLLPGTATCQKQCTLGLRQTYRSWFVR